MVTRQLLLCLFVSITALPMYAQLAGKHTVAISGKLDRNWQKDQVFSRTPRKSWLYGPELAYGYHTGKRSLGLALSASRGQFTTFTETTNEGTQYTGHVAFQVVYRLSSAQNWQYWAGGKVILDFDFLLSDRALRYGWDALLSAYPCFQTRYYGLPKLQVFYESYFSLAGVLWRPNAQGFTLRTEELLETEGVLSAMFENPRFSSWHNALKWSHRIETHYLLSARTTLTAALNVRYVTIAVPRRKSALTNGLHLGIQWNFN